MRFRQFFIFLAVATGAGFALRALSRLPLWACLVTAVGAMLVVGWLAEWEDNRPGGFNNPQPSPLLEGETRLA